MQFTPRQQEILEIVEDNQPISGANIAKQLGLTRATLRSDLAVLTMLGLLDAKPKVGYWRVKKAVTPMLYQRLFGKHVGEIMIPPRWIFQNTTVSEAISALFLHDIGSIYVLDDDENLVGIISRKDLLRISIAGEQNQNYPVAMIMTRMPNIITTYPDATVLDAAEKMVTHQIDTLPVVSRDNPTKVIGRLSKSVLTRYYTQVGVDVRAQQVDHEEPSPAPPKK